MIYIESKTSKMNYLFSVIFYKQFSTRKAGIRTKASVDGQLTCTDKSVANPKKIRW
jgi:hypothetical protein